MVLLDCAINENVAVFTEDGAFALFFRPRGIWQLKSPHPREFAIQGKTNANARGSAREKGGGGALGAAGIDWCITVSALQW